LNRNFEHLATGMRISRAADDAAGVAISARFQAQVRSLDQAVRNANDGVSMVQTAEGGLSEIQSSLTRMRELAVQAANGTLSGSDRTNLDAEFDQLRSSIDQVANSTDFNGNALLNAVANLDLQIGANVGDTLTVSSVDATAATLGLATSATVNLTTAANASTAIGLLDTAINTVTSDRGTFGAIQNRLDSTISSLSVRSENLAAANSRIQDVDVAAETAMMTKNSILQQSALSVLAQANSQPSAALSLLG